MDQLITDRLQDNLSRLKLTQAAEVLDVILKKAEAEKIVSVNLTPSSQRLPAVA
jgi:hypothetical protein